MAYRRRAQNYSSAPQPLDVHMSSSSSSASSLATKAIRASSAHRESSLSSVYEQSALSSPGGTPSSSGRDSSIHVRTATKNVDNSQQGFWGKLARKAKAILADDNDDDIAQSRALPEGTASQTSEKAQTGQRYDTNSSSDKYQKRDGRPLQKGLGAIASSLNYIGDTIGNALEEGITVVENRTANIIQETRKIQIRRNKTGGSMSQKLASDGSHIRQQPVIQSRMQPQAQMGGDLEMQLKASRDVSMAMAAKAKLLLRELKTVKADLAFAKERCGQLEEENRILRENRDKGDNLEDDDLVRLQLETLLAEKARLAHENSVYARENRFLREIVEYHQLTMQDVVYLDESNEEVTEVYPVKVATIPLVPPTPTKPHGAVLQNDPREPKEVSEAVNTTNRYVRIPGQIPAEDLRNH